MTAQKAMLIVGIFTGLSTLWSADASAAEIASEAGLQAMLDAHAAQCRKFGCNQLNLWRGVAVSFATIALAISLVVSGTISKFQAVLSHHLKHNWLVQSCIAAVLASAWLLIPVVTALLSGRSILGKTGVTVVNYKYSHGHWQEYNSLTNSILGRAGDWLGEELFPTFMFGLIGLYIMGILNRRLGRVALAVLLASITAIVGIFALFNHKTDGTPLPEGTLRSQVAEMAQPLGFTADIVRVGSAFTNHYNATARSLPTARIVISPNLLSNSNAAFRNNIKLEAATNRQLAALVGHELAHIEMNHSEWMLILLTFANFLIAFATFLTLMRIAGWKEPFNNEAPATLLLLTFATFLITVQLVTLIQSKISQSHERAADKRGMEIAGDPLGFAQVIVRLNTGKNLIYSSSFDRALSTHPQPAERIAAAIKAERKLDPERLDVYESDAINTADVIP